MIEIDEEPRHIQYTLRAWPGHPEKEVDYWTVRYRGRTYDAKTAEKAMQKAQKDPRNDPESIKRVTDNIAIMRTLYSQAIYAQERLKYNNDDIDHDEMAAAVEQCVELIEEWRRQ